MAYRIVHARLAAVTAHLSLTRKLASDASATRLAVCRGGQKLAADWGSHESVFHSIWLRHNCQCPRCVSSSGQKATATTELDPNVTVEEASIAENGTDVMMKWSCGHEGKIDTDWLKDHCYAPTSLRTALERGMPSITAHGSLPSVNASELEDDRGVWRWLKNLNEHGVCILKGLPTEKESLLNAVGKISHIQKSIYGEVFEVESVEDPINISNTDVELEAHMDLEYYQSPPGLQLLHCVRNDECVRGGESTIVDGLAVLENLRQTHAHHFSTLARVPATFQKIHYKRDSPVHMVYQRPHISLNGNGQIIGFFWSPQFEGPLHVPEDDVLPYYEAYACLVKMIREPRFVMKHKLEVGDLLSFNNQRMLHGRLKFQLNGGVRLLRGIYMNIDEFKNRFRVLCSQYDPGYHPKHVFNEDHGF